MHDLRSAAAKAGWFADYVERHQDEWPRAQWSLPQNLLDDQNERQDVHDSRIHELLWPCDSCARAWASQTRRDSKDHEAAIAGSARPEKVEHSALQPQLVEHTAPLPQAPVAWLSINKDEASILEACRFDESPFCGQNCRFQRIENTWWITSC